MLGNSLASHSLIWFFSSRRFFPAHRMFAPYGRDFWGSSIAAGREGLAALHFLLPNFPSCSREERVWRPSISCHWTALAASGEPGRLGKPPYIYGICTNLPSTPSRP